MERCVGCNEPMDDPFNHHCDPIREAKIEAARRAFDGDREPREPSEAERLCLGLEMRFGWEEEDNEE